MQDYKVIPRTMKKLLKLHQDALVKNHLVLENIVNVMLKKFLAVINANALIAKIHLEIVKIILKGIKILNSG